MARVILEASLEVRHAIVYATLIDVRCAAAGVFPGWLVQGVLPPLAISYSLAMLASMAVALTVTPALGLIVLSRAPFRRESRSCVGSTASNTRILTRIVVKPRTMYATVAVITLGSLVLPHLGQHCSPTSRSETS